MILTIFRRCLNRIGASIPALRLAMAPPVPTRKESVRSPLPRCGARSYFIARQAIRMIGTTYPPPPPREGGRP